MKHDKQVEVAYERPTVVELGTLHELTLATDKNYNPVSDGYTFQHQNINTAS